jgi:hypothetical protein
LTSRSFLYVLVYQFEMDDDDQGSRHVSPCTWFVRESLASGTVGFRNPFSNASRQSSSVIALACPPSSRLIHTNRGSYRYRKSEPEIRRLRSILRVARRPKLRLQHRRQSASPPLCYAITVAGVSSFDKATNATLVPGK